MKRKACCLGGRRRAAARPGTLDRSSPSSPYRCFEPCFDCCKLDEVPVGKAAKMRLTTIIAASCQNNPSCSVVWVWKETDNPIRLESKNFDPLADFLRRFV